MKLKQTFKALFTKTNLSLPKDTGITVTVPVLYQTFDDNFQNKKLKVRSGSGKLLRILTDPDPAK